LPDPAFVDTNIPVYAAGGEDPHKKPCIAIMAELARHPGAGISNAEVLQEILFVYLRRREPLKAAAVIDAFDEALDWRIQAVTREDVLTAARMAAAPSLQARDRIHLAVMARLGVTTIISADRGFDRVSGIRRLDPLQFAEWRDHVFTLRPRG
jgi:uncharacterized protein